MEFYERISGARMPSNYIRPVGVSKDMPTGLPQDICGLYTVFHTNEIDLVVLQIA